MHANQTPVTMSPTPSEHHPALILPTGPGTGAVAGTATSTATDDDAPSMPAVTVPGEEAEEAGYGYGV